MGSVSTFKDSQIFGGIYFYSFALIIIAILFGALYFTTKVTLFHESNKFLEDVTMYLSKCTLSIRELTKECKQLNETMKLRKVFHVRNFEKSKQVAKGYIHQMFNDIRAILDKHENYLINRIDKIEVNHDPVWHHYSSNLKDTTSLTELEILTVTDAQSQPRKDKNHTDGLSNNMENLAQDILQSSSVLVRRKDKENFMCKDNENNIRQREEIIFAGDDEVVDHDARVNEMVIDVENKEEEKGQTQKMENNNDNGDTDDVESVSVKIEKLKKRVDRKYSQYQQVSSKQGLRAFFKTFYKIRGLLIPALTHFFDTATDIALVWEFYILKDLNQFDNQDIDINAFFVLSSGVLMYYRISSGFEVWQFTGNKNETILQFLFDFFLIKLIYINIFKMKSYQASQVIKQFRMIEGGNESAFQAIITFVFLLKSSSFDINSVAVVSLGASLLSLISRLSVLDKNCLIDKAKEIKNFEIGDIFTKPKQAFGKIHKEFVLYRLFRCIEILYSIMLISIFWHFVGGVWLVFLIVVGIANIYQQYKRSGQIRTDWFNYILVINITEVGDYFQREDGFCDCRCSARNTLIPLRIFYVRTIMMVTSVIVLLNNDVISTTSKNVFVYLILVPYVATIVFFFIIIEFWTVGKLSQNSVVENFRIFDYIANDNEECVWFCKYLKCDIFYQIKKVSINNCKLKLSKPYCGAFYEPSNVVEAILRSKNVKYFEIVSQWYDEVKQKNNDPNDDFYSYARTQIIMDDELMRFVQFSCAHGVRGNGQVFEYFVCNDIYFLDTDDSRSNRWVYEMVEISVKLVCVQALNHLITKFATKVACFNKDQMSTIWNQLIDPFHFS